MQKIRMPSSVPIPMRSIRHGQFVLTADQPLEAHNLGLKVQALGLRDVVRGVYADSCVGGNPANHWRRT